MDTKNLSVSEYFVVVQKEYLIAEFRKKIYRNTKDKNYYSKVMLFKKEKINNIAERNALKSIFNDQEKLHEIRSELFNVKGQPLFPMTEIDESNYYYIGSEFSFCGNIFILLQVKDSLTVVIKASATDNVEITVSKSDICRII